VSSFDFRQVRSNRNRLALLATLMPLLLAGCAADAWRAESGYDAYLDRVQKNCEGIRIGGRLIDEPLLNDPYFLDITSRFFNGRVGQPEFVDALTSFYNAKEDSPGIRCLLEQMPAPNSPPPMSMPPVIVK
jgi:hypothetical protein